MKVAVCLAVLGLFVLGARGYPFPRRYNRPVRYAHHRRYIPNPRFVPAVDRRSRASQQQRVAYMGAYGIPPKGAMLQRPYDSPYGHVFTYPSAISHPRNKQLNHYPKKPYANDFINNYLPNYQPFRSSPYADINVGQRRPSSQQQCVWNMLTYPQADLVLEKAIGLSQNNDSFTLRSIQSATVRFCRRCNQEGCVPARHEANITFTLARTDNCEWKQKCLCKPIMGALNITCQAQGTVPFATKDVVNFTVNCAVNETDYSAADSEDSVVEETQEVEDEFETEPNEVEEILNGVTPDVTEEPESEKEDDLEPAPLIIVPEFSSS